MREGVYTKKADAATIKIATSLKPDLTKNASWNECWEIIAIAYGLEGGVDMKKSRAEFEIYKDNQKIHTISWPASEVFHEGEYDFNIMYKAVIEWLFANLLKKPRKQRKDAKKQRKAVIDPAAIMKHLAKEEEEEEECTVTEAAPMMTRDQYKRKIHNLWMKMYNYRKKNKDVSEIQKEYDRIQQEYKELFH